MKKNSVNFKSLLFKSFYRTDKMMIILIIASFLCSLLISGIWSINSASKIKRLQNTKLLFGEYQVGVNDIDKSLVDKILNNEKNIDRYTLFTQRILQDENGIENIIYAKENFFSLSQINLQTGTFPKNQNEILIDDLYAFEKGKDSYEIIGNKINLNNKEYVISGVINNSDFNIESITAHTYILNYNANINTLENKDKISFLAKINSIDISNFINKLNDNYKINNNLISYNASAYSYAGINTKGLPNGIEGIFYKAIVIVISLLSTFLLYTLCILYMKKLKSTTSICIALGISFKKMHINFISFIMFSIFLCFISSQFISILSVSLIFKLSCTDVIIRNVFSIIIIAIVFIVVGLLLLLNVVTSNVNKIEQNLKNPTDIKNNRVKSAIKRSYKSLYLSLSQQNISVTKKRVVLYILIIVITSILFSVSLYSIQIFKDSSQKIKEFDYMLEFKYNNVTEIMNGLEEHEILFNRAQNDIEKNIYSIYFESIYTGIYKSNITKGHRDYLEKLSTQISISLNNPNTDIVNIPAMLMCLDDDTIKRISKNQEEIIISQNECIVVKNTIDVMGSGFEIGLNNGDHVLISVPLDESEIEEIDFDDTYHEGKDFVQPQLPETTETLSIKVIDTIDFLDINLQQIKNFPLILVNKDTFNKISTNSNYPSIVLFDNDKNNPDFIKKYFSGKTGIQLYDLLEENKISEEYFKKIDFSLMTIMTILIIFLTLIMSITIILRYNESKSQYAVMRAIGIRPSNIMKIFICEALYFSAISSLITIPLSILGTFIVYKNFINQSVFFIYKTPIVPIAIPILCFIIVSIISYLPVIYKMQRESIAEVIKHE